MPFIIPDHDESFDDNQSIWFETDIAILVAGLAGVGPVSGCGVTAQGSPDMTVAIAAGTIRIASGALVTVSSGNGTISTADATNPRIDLVSASDSGTKTVTAGTAAASPKPPDLPSGHIALAMVYVPANDTTIASNQITDKRAMQLLKPGHEYEYQEVTSDVTISATAEGSATTIITADAVTFDGVTAVNIEFAARYFGFNGTGNAGDSLNVWLFQDGSSIGTFANMASGGTSTQERWPCYGHRRLTPSAGSHTYSVRATVTNASRTGIVGGGAGGSGNGTPITLRITKA
jgi:hypothetical protein